MVASIGAAAAPSQGASNYELDGYYAKDDPEHRAASTWAGKGAAGLGLEGPVDPDTFKKDGKESIDKDRTGQETGAPSSPEKGIEPEASRGRAAEPEPPTRGKGVDMDLGL